MIEKWRESLDSGGNLGALWTDLSKVFECFSHDLLLAKLHAYRLDMPSLKLLHAYLTKRRRVKINNRYSSWSEILFGVSQGSILGPLLFNIFLYDLFLFIPDIGIATMLTIILLTPPINILKLYLTDLEKGSDILLKWFIDTLLKGNPEKHHFLLSVVNAKNY